MIAVYLVTYRRPHLLERALESVRQQTYEDWTARVVNDDPDDGRVEAMVSALRDPRIRILEPVRRRGGAGNFNLAFQETQCAFASILEDDNWWEPGFLKTMFEALAVDPHIEVACGNERIYKENEDATWTRGATIWPDCLDGLYSTDVETACGSAKLCNSSLLFRTRRSAEWQTPDDIPVDVTEHFRERVIPQPIRLVGEPLVNYADTIATSRASGTLWAEYQCLLIGSCFRSTPPHLRESLARKIWRSVGTGGSPRATALLVASLVMPEAFKLWTTSSLYQKTRLAGTVAKRLPDLLALRSVRQRLDSHFQFLCDSPFNRRLEGLLE